MKISNYVSKETLQVALFVIVVAGIGVMIGKNMAKSSVQQDMNGKLIRKARAGSINARKAIASKKKQVQQIESGSNIILSSIGVLAVLVLMALFITMSETKIKSYRK